MRVVVILYWAIVSLLRANCDRTNGSGVRIVTTDLWINSKFQVWHAFIVAYHDSGIPPIQDFNWLFWLTCRVERFEYNQGRFEFRENGLSPQENGMALGGVMQGPADEATCLQRFSCLVQTTCACACRNSARKCVLMHTHGFVHFDVPACTACVCPDHRWVLIPSTCWWMLVHVEWPESCESCSGAHGVTWRQDSNGMGVPRMGTPGGQGLDSGSRNEKLGLLEPGVPRGRLDDFKVQGGEDHKPQRLTLAVFVSLWPRVGDGTCRLHVLTTPIKGWPQWHLYFDVKHIVFARQKCPVRCFSWAKSMAASSSRGLKPRVKNTELTRIIYACVASP